MDKYLLLFNAAKEEACKLGIEEFELFFSEGGGISCDTFRDEISEFSSSTDRALSLRVVYDGKIGYANTQLFEPEEVASLVARAAENASIIEKDDRAIIYPAGDSYASVPECVYEQPSAAFLRSYALECRDALYASDGRMADGSSCGVYSGYGSIRLMNSKGLDLSSFGGTSGVYMEAVLEDSESKEKQAGGEDDFDCFDTLDKSKLAAKAVDEAAKRFGGGFVKTGKYDVVFDTHRMRDFLATFSPVFFADRSQKKLSRLSRENVGDTIASPVVSIVDDPFYPGNTMQKAFDGEGVPTRTKAVVENGVLKTMLYNLNSAEKDNVEPTGNASRSGSSIGTGVSTFYIKPGTMSRDDLFKKVGNGIYVTDMKGFHAGADNISGDFSIESEGFIIENGKIGRRIKSFTVSGNFFDLLMNITDVGSEIEFGGPGYSRIAAPDTLVSCMSVAGE